MKIRGFLADLGLLLLFIISLVLPVAGGVAFIILVVRRLQWLPWGMTLFYGSFVVVGAIEWRLISIYNRIVEKRSSQ